jgi:chromosome segregation ATPase
MSMTSSYRKITDLLRDRETVTMQIRAHRVITLRKQQLLCNTSIMSLAGKKNKSIEGRLNTVEKHLDKLNDQMKVIEEEISKVFYVRANLDSLIEDAECQEEEVSNALVELTLSVS